MAVPKVMGVRGMRVIIMMLMVVIFLSSIMITLISMMTMLPHPSPWAFPGTVCISLTGLDVKLENWALHVVEGVGQFVIGTDRNTIAIRVNPSYGGIFRFNLEQADQLLLQRRKRGFFERETARVRILATPIAVVK